MLCCQGFEVKNYDFTLGRLAYENLRLVQSSGIINRAPRFYETRLRRSQNKGIPTTKIEFIPPY